MTPQPAPLAVGLIGLPDLAGPLRRAGFRVVTGDGFLGAAAAVKRVVDGGAALPVLILETAAGGMGAYVTALAGRGVPTVLLRPGVPVIDAADPVAVVDLPAGIDEVLAAGGLGPVGGSTGSGTVDCDGAVRETAAPPPARWADPWADDETWPGEPDPAPDDRDAPAGADVTLLPGPGHPPADRRPAAGTPQRAAAVAGNDPCAVFDAAPHHPALPVRGRRLNDRRGELLFVFAGKGGVGTTGVALALAERAGRQLRVVLVDADRGQGDIRTYLRLTGSSLPTVWAAAASGDPARAIVAPGELTAARHPRMQELHFALVMAPHGDQTDPGTVTPALYGAVLAEARDRADLVVVDTPVVPDGPDGTGLIDELLVPELRAGGWGLAVTDTSAAGLTNTLDRLRAVHRAGVPPDRQMAVLSRVAAGFTDRQIAAVAELLGRHTSFLGHIPESPALQDAANLGRVEHRDPGLAAVLDAALLRVTGDPAFQPAGTGRASRRWRLPIGARR